MNAVGFRVQTLGIQVAGENRQLGFSGAYLPDQLWTEKVMVGECGTDETEDDDNTFATMPQGYVATGGYRTSLIRPETMKVPKRTKLTARQRCENHLLAGAQDANGTRHCSCGIYAFKKREDLFSQYNPDSFGGRNFITVVTEVIGWGKIAEYAEGWRFQYCRPIGMTLVAGTTDAERNTRLVIAQGRNGNVGRFLRPGVHYHEFTYRDPRKEEIEIPLHFVISMLSGKFACQVNLGTSAQTILDGETAPQPVLPDWLRVS